MPKRKSVTKQPMSVQKAPRGQVGKQTYDQVRKVVEEKKIPLLKAFEEVAKATNRRPGTIAVTYYRIGRIIREGAGKGSGARGRGRSSAVDGNIRAVFAQLSATIAKLEKIVTEQATEIARLRSESELADRIRKALRS
jgi:hypothetical protein